MLWSDVEVFICCVIVGIVTVLCVSHTVKHTVTHQWEQTVISRGYGTYVEDGDQLVFKWK